MVKRISLLYDYLAELGGLERMMFSHANWLNEKHHVNLTYAAVNKEVAETLKKDFGLKKNIPIVEFSKIKLNEAIKVCSFIISKKSILKQKPDLLICYSFLCSYLAYRIKKKYNIPYWIVMCHPPNFLYFNNLKERVAWINHPNRLIAAVLGFFFSPILKRMDRIAVKNANKVFPISNYTRKRAINIYGKQDYIILYPPLADPFKIVDKEKLKPFIEKYNIKRPFIYTTGRIIPDKKFEWIIEAFRVLPGNYDLIISGMIKDNYKEVLLNLIRKYNLNNRIKILGPIPREDLIALYNLASVFVLSAPKEDFGLVPIEAIASGTPVAAWNDQAGPNETIKDGFTGFFAEPYNRNALADTILKASKLKKNNKDFEQHITEFRTNAVRSTLLKEIKKSLV